jgi:hypothetical protein
MDEISRLIETFPTEFEILLLEDVGPAFFHVESTRWGNYPVYVCRVASIADLGEIRAFLSQPSRMGMNVKIFDPNHKNHDQFVFCSLNKTSLLE